MTVSYPQKTKVIDYCVVIVMIPVICPVQCTDITPVVSKFFTLGDVPCHFAFILESYSKELMV